MPAFPKDLKSFKSYPSNFEVFYQDNLGFRNILVSLHNTIKMKLFSTTPVKQVIIGKKGWLYYAESHAIEDFRGLHHFSQDQLDMWKNTLELRRIWLEEQGIKYLFVIAPEKQTIYPEFIPDHLQKVNRKTRFDQLSQYLKKQSKIKFIDLRNPLNEAKDKHLVYFKTDTHWTPDGAYIAYENIINNISPWFPDLITIGRSSLSKVKYEGERDIAKMLGMIKPLKESNDLLFIKAPCARNVDMNIPSDAPPSTQGSIFSKGCNDMNRRAVVFRDSFFEAIEPFLSENFEVITYVWKPFDYFLLNKLIQEMHPDIVIEEIVERLLTAPYPPAPEIPHSLRANLEKQGLKKNESDLFKTVLLFNNPAILKYQSGGWHGIEPDGCWTSKYAVLILPVTNPDRDLEIVTHVIPFIVPGKIDHQTVEVSVNGNLVETWKLSDGVHELRILIPNKYLKSGTINLSFKTSNPATPLQYGLNKDARTLGVFFRKMRFNMN